MTFIPSSPKESNDKLKEILEMRRLLSITAKTPPRIIPHTDNPPQNVENRGRSLSAISSKPGQFSSSGGLGASSPGPKLPPDSKLTEEHLATAVKNSDLRGLVLQWDNPAEMFMAIVDDIAPYKWQIDELCRLCGYTNPTYDSNGKILGPKTPPTQDAPLQYILAAANGSGKDQVIIAAFTVWYACTAKRSRVVITSASTKQIRTQTDPYIRLLFSYLNKFLGRVYVRSVQGYHAIPEIGSRVELHVTDEEGKSEGAHPDPGGRMAVIINEAKEVKPGIYRGLSRCSGYDTWIEVSSPGAPAGNFYENYVESDKYPAPLRLGHYYSRRISGYDCPNLKEHQRLNCLRMGGGGDTNPYYESSWLAQFSTINEDLIIHPYMVLASATAPTIFGKKKFGLDIGATGDPTDLYLICGNQVEYHFEFNEGDLFLQTEKLFKYFVDCNYLEAEGFGDHNGLGMGVVDGLRHKGIKITGVFNQESALDYNRYVNLGTEMYFNVRDLVLAKLLPIPVNDRTLHDELTNRYFFEKGNGKKAIEPKKVYKKRHDGRSPNRADAYCLAFLSTTVATLSMELKGILPAVPIDPMLFSRPKSLFSSISTSKPKAITAWDISA